MHVHGLQFGVVAREGGEPNHDLRAGLVDEGRQDTVLVLPGERVRIALAFDDFDGLYMYHCHNMEHEDNGMMRYYRIEVYLLMTRPDAFPTLTAGGIVGP
jgi:FtsP/CotA-like multicopper oxidase with cupredoxin domain